MRPAGSGSRWKSEADRTGTALCAASDGRRHACPIRDQLLPLGGPLSIGAEKYQNITSVGSAVDAHISTASRHITSFGADKAGELPSHAGTATTTVRRSPSPIDAGFEPGACLLPYRTVASSCCSAAIPRPGVGIDGIEVDRASTTPKHASVSPPVNSTPPP